MTRRLEDQGEPEWDRNDTDDPRNWPGGGAVCPQCGVVLTPENMVGNVTDKGPTLAPGEQLNQMDGIVEEMMCRRCFGIPEGV